MTTVCVKFYSLGDPPSDEYRHGFKKRLKEYQALKRRCETFYKSLKNDKLEFMGFDQDGFEVYMDQEAQRASPHPLETPIEVV